MKKQLLCILISMGMLNSARSESFSDQDDSTKVKVKRPFYAGIGLGNNISKFRDYATSPLFYSGTAKTISVFVDRPSDKKDMFIQARYSAGTYRVKGLGDDDLFSKLKSASVRYTMLWKVNPISGNKLNIKIGGTFDAWGDLRINKKLQNNTVGSEIFTTLFLSLKVSHPIVVTETKKIWFLKFKPRYRNTYFQLNLPVMNNTFRNGYIYTSTTGLDGNPKPSLFKGYEFHTFSGLRLSTSLMYEQAIFNNNILRFTYDWDMLLSSKKYDQFQMANHIFLVSLVLKLK
ncbi:MAG TPA: hypothetical protein VK796_04130 [Cytophaga sp.]|jgi:hypothetical protein|nr:hypothetical protein [Cytophaga sp.]